MNKPHLIFVLSILSFTYTYAQKQYEYPIAPKVEVSDKYYDTVVKDDYRYLENPEDERTKLWLEQQEKVKNKYARKLLAQQDIRKWMYQLYDTDFKPFEKDEEEDEKEAYYFKRKIKSLNKTPDLYWKKGEHGYFSTLVKVKDHRRSKGDNVFITDYDVDDDDKYVAVEMTHSGSDWRETYLYDLESGTQLTDTIQYTRSLNVVWQGEGFYYMRYDKPAKGKELLDARTGQRLCYHKVGDKQEDDKTLFYNPDKENKQFMYYGMVDSINMILTYPMSVKGKWYQARSIVDVTDIDSFLPKNFLISPNDDGVFYSIEAIYGDSLIMRTNLGSPNHRVLVCDKTKLNKVYELVPEYEDNLVSVRRLSADKIACIYLLDGVNSVLIFNLKGELLKSIRFPEGKRVSGFRQIKEKGYCNYWVSSYYHPSIRYKMDIETFESQPAGQLSIPYEYDLLHTEYVKYKSKDGTEVPMYITYAKKLNMDGTNPTLIYGYGGYGVTVKSRYQKDYMVWLLNGGILAVPNIRGGGAEGSDWAEAGRGLNKQNAIDDFVAAAEYLQQNSYTSPEKTAIKGGSHGGMLVGAAMTQRPELYKAVIASAGVYDMLRFESFTIGNALGNNNEFGTTADSLQFNNLLSYSPLHNIKKGVNYPSILIKTGDNDDRVPPLHSYKFAAALQEKGASTSPYILKVTKGVGHGGALTLEEYFLDISFQYNFLMKELDFKLKDRVHAKFGN